MKFLINNQMVRILLILSIFNKTYLEINKNRIKVFLNYRFSHFDTEL
jgi:hypothetical protein